MNSDDPQHLFVWQAADLLLLDHPWYSTCAFDAILVFPHNDS